MSKPCGKVCCCPWQDGRTKAANEQTIGPKEDIIFVKEGEQEVLKNVPENYGKDLAKIIKEDQDIFPEKLPKGVPPKREVQHKIEIDPGSKPPYQPPYRLGPIEQGSLGSRFHPSILQSVWGTGSIFAKERRKMADVH